MGTNIVQMTDGAGNIQYPKTNSDAVGMMDGSGNLTTYLNKRVTEINVSNIYKTNGIDGGNTYTLETAIAQVPAEYRNIQGLKITFVNDETRNIETWVYKEGTFTAVENWEKSNDNEKITEIENDLIEINKELGDIVVIDTKLKINNYKITENGDLSNSAGLRARYFDVTDLDGKIININRDAKYSGYQYAFYNVLREDNNSFSTFHNSESLLKLGDNFVNKKELFINVEVPVGAKSLLVMSIKDTEVDNYLVTVSYKPEKNRLDKIESQIVELEDKLSNNLGRNEDVTDTIYVGTVNNYYIDPATQSVITTGGGGGYQRFTVSDYVGKRLNLHRISANFSRGMNWAFAKVQCTTSVPAENIISISNNYANTELNESVIVPEGSIELIIFGRNSDYPATVILNETLLEAIENVENKIPTINNEGKPSYDGWNSGGTVTPESYQNFNVLNKNGELVYGGANLLYGKTIKGFGDSLFEGGQWLRTLSVMAAITFRIYAMGGKQSTPTASAYSPAASEFRSMQDFVNKAINDGEDSDIILFENVNDLNRCYETGNIGELSDDTFFVSQYIEYENGYASAESAKQGFTDNFNTIIRGATFKKGSIINVKYQAVSYTLTLTGTPQRGSIDLNVGDTQRTISVDSSNSVEDIASNIAIFDFPGYNTSASGSTVTFIAQDGTVATEPIVENNTSGVSINIKTSSSSSWVFYYFRGFIEDDWNNIEKWSDAVPTLYSIYKGIVEALMTTYPKSRLIFFQPVFVLGGKLTTYPDGSINVYAFSQDTYQTAWKKCREVQKNICKLYNIECIDMADYSSINPINARLGGWYGDDAIHYLTETWNRTAEVVYRLLS